MDVQLTDYTGYGLDDPARRAANVLLFTKSTRLNMSAALMHEIEAWPQEKVDDELKYMADTLPSSWEFLHLSFSITGVTRAFTHQLVRTRTASYAQQAMRIVKVNEGAGWDHLIPNKIDADELMLKEYEDAMANIAQCHKHLMSLGADAQDARGILPTNILTNICMSINFRNFCDLVKKRDSYRVQGEYRDVVHLMVERVLHIWPWANVFINSSAAKDARELEAMILNIPNLDEKYALSMIKKVYKLRNV